MKLDDIRQTFVPRSDFKDQLGNFILHSDKNSYLAWQNTQKLIELMTNIQEQNKQILSALQGRKS